MQQRSREHNKWYIYPDQIGGQHFRGYRTENDITQELGAFPVGQNIIFTSGRTPTPRPGIELIGESINVATPVKRAWVFEKRDGIQIEMKVVGTTVYYRIDGEMDDFKILESGFTDTSEWTYAVISETSDINSRLNFCNGKDAWRKWTGEYAKYVSDNGSNEITVDTKLSEPAYLTTGNQTDGFVSEWAGISDGSFRITIDGTARNIDNINFTGVTSMDEVAAVIQAKIRTVTSGQETVEYKDRAFIIKSGIASSSSSISVLTTSTGTVGTDISGAGANNWLDGDTGNGVVTNRSLLTFTDNGNIIDKNGTIIKYTSVDGYTFKNCSSVPVDPVVGDILVQGTTFMSGTSILKSSLAFAHDGRIHARNELKKSVSAYSKLDDPDDWTTGSNDGDGGLKEFELGGPITAYAHDEEKLYIFKKRLIATLQYIQGSTRIDVPKYGTLKPGDDKSITVGAVSAKSTFHTPNGICFLTEDKQLLHLTRDKSIDYPQGLDISLPIKPTFENGIHDEAVGICYNGQIFYAYKSDNSATYNDTVLIYDIEDRIWYPPTVGWNVSDWTIVNGELHFHSSLNPDSYKIITDKLDNGEAFTTILRSWDEDFGHQDWQKTCGYVMLDIYMKENSEVNADILYDIDGRSGKETFILKGTDTKNLLSAQQSYNPLGASPFGRERFGSNADIAGMKKYRYFLELKNNVEFFTIALQLSTETVASDYEMIRFGYFITQYIELIPRGLLIKPNRE